MDDFPQIEVLDANGMCVLRYLRLADDCYYGGWTYEDVKKVMPFIFSPHTRMMTGGMLDLIARIANLEKPFHFDYQLQGHGSGRYDIESITREMHSDKVAAILGCDEKTIRDHFDRMILIPAEADGG